MHRGLGRRDYGAWDAESTVLAGVEVSSRFGVTLLEQCNGHPVASASHPEVGGGGGCTSVVTPSQRRRDPVGQGDLVFPISTVAERTGLSPDTLRVWEHRYGLGASRESPGGHRRYTRSDLSRLHAALDLIRLGVSPAEAARSVLRSDEHGLILPDDVEPAAHRLAATAIELDGPNARAILREGLRRSGTSHTWEALVRPVLVAIGEQWADLPHGIAVEHLLSRVAAGVLGEAAHSADRPPRPPGVLLACVPEEQHDLPLVALAAALAERGIASALLGARTPTISLNEVAARQCPAVTVLHAQMPELAHSALLFSWRGPGELLACGPGWRRSYRPNSVTWVDDLGAAVDAVSRIA